MKRILFSFILLFCLIFIIGQNISTNCYAQATAGQHNPYQNLAKWYGTQSAPTALEKAQWGLEDVNVYRTENGLKPLSEKVLTATKIRYSHDWTDWLVLIGTVINIVLFIYWLCFLVKEYKPKQNKQEESPQNEEIPFAIVDPIKEAKAAERVNAGVTNNSIECDRFSPELFPVIWREMDEKRRQNSTGLFVYIYDREPTKHEITSGNIYKRYDVTD
ncbi:MAG: hypothetical protein LBL62_10925 [Planctomycetaceae bacterium]|jgi:hypothetical protein|nr:hypothetical protein [Planctomycetaceae bacterium]